MVAPYIEYCATLIKCYFGLPHKQHPSRYQDIYVIRTNTHIHHIQKYGVSIDHIAFSNGPNNCPLFLRPVWPSPTACQSLQETFSTSGLRQTLSETTWDHAPFLDEQHWTTYSSVDIQYLMLICYIIYYLSYRLYYETYNSQGVKMKKTHSWSQLKPPASVSKQTTHHHKHVPIPTFEYKCRTSAQLAGGSSWPVMLSKSMKF